MLDFIGDVGGFNDAISLMIEFIMSNYTGNLLLASLIKSFFKVDLFAPSSDPKYKKGIYKGVTNRHNFIDDMIEPLKKRLIETLQKKDKEKTGLGLDQVDI